ncbi:MAG: c-type cytochrome domain-containing protein [Planctomycetaceae bacterium]
MAQKFHLCLSLLVLFSITGCAENQEQPQIQVEEEEVPQAEVVEEEIPPLPEPVDREVSYSEEIFPIFEEKCLSCHESENKKGKFSLSTHEELMAGGKSGAVVLPGKSSESKLVLLVHSKKMPTKRSGNAPLSPEQVSLIRGWIDQGASE